MVRRGSNSEQETLHIYTLDNDNTFLGGEFGDCFNGNTSVDITFLPNVDQMDYNMCYYGNLSDIEPTLFYPIDKQNPENQTPSMAQLFVIPDNMFSDINCIES